MLLGGGSGAGFDLLVCSELFYCHHFTGKNQMMGGIQEIKWKAFRKSLWMRSLVIFHIDLGSCRRFPLSTVSITVVPSPSLCISLLTYIYIIYYYYIFLWTHSGFWNGFCISVPPGRQGTGGAGSGSQAGLLLLMPLHNLLSCSCPCLLNCQRKSLYDWLSLSPHWLPS